MKYFFTALVLLLCYSARSQEKLEFVDVDKIVNELSVSVQNKNFDKVVEGINSIPKNDSLYCSLLISKSYYLMQAERYEESLDVYDEALEQACADQLREIKINQAALYLRTEDYENSFKISTEILNESPYDRSALYNRALVLQKLGRFEESIQSFQELLRINPLEPDVHLQLGILCYKRGLTAQALLCLNTWMLLNEDLESNIDQLSKFNKMSFTPYDGESFSYRVSAEDESFSTIDKILNQGLALQGSYETSNDIDLQLIKQNHILFTYLKDFKAGNGVWSSIYIPVFKKMMSEGKFNEFTYYVTRSLKESDYESIYRRNEKDALEVASEMIVDLISTAAKSDPEKEYHYDRGILQAIGKTLNGNPIGEYTFIDAKGNINSKGSFNNNHEKNGFWESYYGDGRLKEKFNFKEGRRNGLNSGYHSNGQVNYEINYVNDEATGEYRQYNENGGLVIKKNLKNGMNDGEYKGFFEIGEDAIEYEAFYKDDNLEGVLKEFYRDGKLYEATLFENNLKKGAQKTYNFNGILISELNYLNDELNGASKNFYNEGNLEQESTFKEGHLIGDYISYHYNNQVAVKTSYNDNGKLDGLYQEYSDDGKLWYEYEYSNGKINKFTYYDKSGRILSQGKKKGGDLDFKAFTARGVLYMEGVYDSRDGKKGEWKYYDANSGYLKNKGGYDDNKAIGSHISYYPNGSERDVAHYEMDQLVNYGANYYPDGNIQLQGFYLDGEKHGKWESYYVDGTIENRSYYHKGQLINWNEYYDVTGGIYLKELYQDNKLKKEVFYNSNGVVNFDISYPVGASKKQRTIKNEKGGVNYVFEMKNGVLNGSYIHYGENKKVLTKGSYLNGSKHGKWEWYYSNGQLEMVETYKLNRNHGAVIGYYEDGVVEFEYEYFNDQFQGTYLSYYENGTIDTSGTYLFGELHGDRKQYDPQGNLQIVRTYDHGDLIGYSYFGKEAKMKEMIPVEKESASVKSYYQTGQISRDYQLKNGEVQGTYNVYYSNGELLSTTEYVNGLMEGEEAEYYSNGNLKIKSIRLKDLKHGTEIAYHENGKKKYEIDYLNGKKHGQKKTYNKNGELINTQNYINDTLQFQ